MSKKDSSKSDSLLPPPHFLHYIAILASGIPSEVVAAVDVNTVANDVYMLNFPTTPLWPKTIEVSNSIVDHCCLGILSLLDV